LTLPNEASTEADAAWAELAQRIAGLLARWPRGNARVARLTRPYQGRTWATRRRLWVDRIASAWLDPPLHRPEGALLRWLASASECPKSALGFSTSTARPSHVGDRVTSTLLASWPRGRWRWRASPRSSTRRRRRRAGARGERFRSGDRRRASACATTTRCSRRSAQCSIRCMHFANGNRTANGRSLQRSQKESRP
jgi:hypothetical protein